MSAVEVRPVSTTADFKAFFEFPWTLYRDDPNWTPPLLSMRRELLDKKKNPAWEYMEGEYFAAWRGERIVGTITAHINHRHNEFHNEKVGWFGFFEVYDDQEAASALLQTAGRYVQERGYEAIRGPQSFTTHEECGLLVEGFTPPMLLMPYNPPHYQRLVEGAGFVKAMDLYSMYMDKRLMQQHNNLERIGKLVDRAVRRSNITIRPINTKRKKAEFRLFKELYNDAWEANWGFVPMTERELDALVESLGIFFDPKMAFFAEVNGDPAGFILSIPNFNEVLHRVYPRPGVPELWSLLKAGWYWKARRVIRSARTPLMGVRAQYRNRGIDLALLYELGKTLIPSQYEFLDSGWILETNDLVKISLSLGNLIYKTHRLYEKSFA